MLQRLQAATILFAGAILGSVSVGQEPTSISAIVDQWTRHTAQLQSSLQIEVDIRSEANATPKELQQYLNKVRIRKGREIIAAEGVKRHLTVEQEAGGASGYALERPEVDNDASPRIRKNQEDKQKQWDDAMARLKQQEEMTGIRVDDLLAQAAKARPMASENKAVFNGEQMRTLDAPSAVAATGSVFPKASIQNKNKFQSLYLTCAGLYFSDPSALDEADALARQIFLPFVLQSSNYTVTSESLDGVSCVRLDGTAGPDSVPDTIWLDIEHGFMLRQRELKAESADSVVVRFENSQPKEVASGIWIPMMCRLVEFAPPGAPERLRKLPMVVTTLTVSKAQVGDLPDSLFDLGFPPGTLVADATVLTSEGKPISYVMPADPAMLNRVILEAVTGERSLLRPSSRSWYWILSFNAVVVFVVIGIACLHRMRKARSKVNP